MDSGLIIGLAAAAVLLLATRAKAAASSKLPVDDAAAFVAVVNEALQRVVPSLPLSGRALAIGQAALESGWGKTRQAREGYNVWNLIRIGEGAVITGGDKDAQGRPITQRWAAYTSLDEAAAAWFKLLGASRYTGAIAALHLGDAATFAAALKKGGYFASPLDEYTKGLAAVQKSALRRMPA